MCTSTCKVATEFSQKIAKRILQNKPDLTFDWELGEGSLTLSLP